jgi:hypothetical protein
MIFQHNRPEATRYFFAAVLLFSLAYSCGQPASDPKRDLIASLKGAEVRGYLFALKENEAQTTASLTNRLANHPIFLGKANTGLVLSYARIEDNKTKIAKIYKSEIIRTTSSLTLLVTDVENRSVVEKSQRPLALPDLNDCSGQQLFDTYQECEAAVYCSTIGVLQCEANRTCQVQFGGQTCCLKNGTGADAFVFAKPNTTRCLEQASYSSIGNLVVAVEP